MSGWAAAGNGRGMLHCPDRVGGRFRWREVGCCTSQSRRGADAWRCISPVFYLNLYILFLQEDGDLHTPLQSPQPPSILIHQDKDLLDTLDPTAIADGNYLQCDLCHISCTDSEYLKRHRWGYEMLTYLELWFLFTRRMAHHVDIFKSLEGLVFNCVQCSFSGSNKQSLADHVR